MTEQPRPLTEYDRQCIQAYQTWVAMGCPDEIAKVAAALDIPRHTFSNRLLKFFVRDLGDRLPIKIMPGHEVKGQSHRLDKHGNVVGQTIRTGTASSDEEFEMPEGFRLHRGTYQVDGNGNLERRWLKITEDEIDKAAVVESIKMAAEEAAVVAAQAAEDIDRTAGLRVNDRRDDLLNFHPLPDLHLGLYVWGQHCGISWDLKTAISCLKGTMLDLMQRAPAAQKGIILGGGDLLHADDETKKTRRSGHVLDVDGRYPKVLKEAELLLVYQVELALQKYEEVEVRILPGNHDDDSSVAIPHFLWAWFRNEPRVTVDLDPGPFWHYEWGKVMLSATHGHETKIEDMPKVMAADEAQMWGRTEFRHAHGFHWHSKRLGGEGGGADWEVHRTPIPRDAYANDHGFRSGRSMQVISYGAEDGEDGRTIKNL